MTALVYKIDGRASRSVAHATLVAEVPVDEVPEDLNEFAAEHGGEFVQIVTEEALV